MDGGRESRGSARVAVAAGLLAGLLWGCSGEADGGGGSTRGGGRPRTPPERAVGGPRSEEARVVEIRRALEQGRPDEARRLLGEVGEGAGIEGPLLRARAALSLGDGVGALREIEAARATWPGDGRVYATAAEVYAALGRFRAAERELDLGQREAGRTAEIERATGVVLIFQAGGVERGLAHLERARALDPDLPFLASPLSQALVLVGRRLLSQPDPEAALDHAQRAARLDPASLDAVELEADARAVLLDVDGALELYARLEGAGRDLGDTIAILHHHAATRCLLQRDRGGAVEHYRLARARGMDDEGLGFGATLLGQEAEAAIDRGVEAYGAGEWEAAAEAFRSALWIDVTSREAQNHLAVVLFRQERYGEAAALWGEVLRAGLAGEIELAEPVHLNLVRALVLSGEPGPARAVLADYLEREPEGPWAEETREALRRLDSR